MPDPVQTVDAGVVQVEVGVAGRSEDVATRVATDCEVPAGVDIIAPLQPVLEQADSVALGDQRVGDVNLGVARSILADVALKTARIVPSRRSGAEVHSVAKPTC